MRPRLKPALCALLCATALPSAALAAGEHHAGANEHRGQSGREGSGGREGGARHVLLISVDGLHASDLQKWVAANPQSALASLNHQGTSYTNALTTTPSDSFPGMLALATGGTPKSTGVYYDDSYDRTLYPPTDTNCTGKPGTEAIYNELADVNMHLLSGGVSPHNGASVDPNKLPRRKTQGGGCEPVLPSQFLRTNTIFNVVHNAGLRTAWSDKHPAYQLLNGPDPQAINDLYTPEINSDAPGGDYTSSEANVQTYDSYKVQATLNEIGGKPSECPASGPCPTVGVPAVFGMNFQAVSVGQKLPNPGSAADPNGCGSGAPCPYIGGYAPDGSFNPNLASAMRFVDNSLGSMVARLRDQGLLRSTEIIITAKHGQSPIDPNKLHRANPDDLNALVSQTTGATFPDPVSGLGQEASTTTDDIALIWLSSPFQSKTGALVSALQQPQNRQRFDIAQVISGRQMRSQFGNPANDPRVPDVIVQPKTGGLYSFSQKKVAEHGGGTRDDRNVALLVVDPRGSRGGESDASVSTTQVAPTILRYLGLDPQALQSVRKEGTQVLPQRAGRG